MILWYPELYSRMNWSCGEVAIILQRVQVYRRVTLIMTKKKGKRENVLLPTAVRSNSEIFTPRERQHAGVGAGGRGETSNRPLKMRSRCSLTDLCLRRLAWSSHYSSSPSF